ncbi:hypothetical protein PF005_g29860 [Phytophthora fragariae]|uniref:Uncharacterized protein n=1 Tax=Phytophthora fragariae TaxID=53985 RepID=A0A6A3H2W3_9STRA|nr:hypothetical protein PF009_g30215 [Phytophthora fragariae]KAE8963567.1 hypothetical protein PF011_g28981 [Phytophthora fragariae]KAE9062162.1 hypothetical protein PF010_g29516 [Phytophthora fragariae]KAE9063111.1 hypothetical protein PF007_g29659 [Phytophthora fragariae]KAE9069370.1 hypothetical protein PF006_g29590 [Phytophthora fragariae]
MLTDDEVRFVQAGYPNLCCKAGLKQRAKAIFAAAVRMQEAAA